MDRIILTNQLVSSVDIWYKLKKKWRQKEEVKTTEIFTDEHG